MKHIRRLRRIALTAILALTCVLCCAFLASCGEPVRFQTLKETTDDGGATILYTKVMPSVQSFSFTEEAKLGGGVTLTVASDEFGTALGVFESGVIPLTHGDNIVYLIVKKNGAVVATHKVNVYRLRNVQVQFDTGTSDGTLPVDIVEGSAVTPPETPVRPGYTFLGWGLCTLNDKFAWQSPVVPYEFSYPIASEDIHMWTGVEGGTITTDYVTRFEAMWQANTDTPYKIEHYAEDVNGKYTLFDTEEKTGTTDFAAKVSYKTNLASRNLLADRDHPNTVASAKIAGDGSTVLKLYYSLKRVTLEATGGGTVTKAGEYRYGASSFTATATAQNGFKFLGWYDESGTKLSGKTTYTFTCKKDVTVRFVPDTSLNASDYFVLNGTTITGVKDTSATTLVIPSSVTAIAEDAFSECTRLRAIYIPASVTTIEIDAFYGCSYSLVAYCEAKSKPAGWDSYWARRKQEYSYYGGYKNYFIEDIQWGYAFE